MRISIFVVCLWFATSPLQGKIVFTSKRDGNTEIYMMNSDGSNQTRLTFNEVSDSDPAWSPNGRQIAFHRLQNKNYEVYVMDADGGNEQNLSRHHKVDGSPDWSPNGSLIAFNSDRDGGEQDRFNIFVMNPSGFKIKQITDVGFASQPKWSPDGKRIAFEGFIGGPRHIYIINADGKNRWQVSEPIPGAAMFLGGWSPDGKRILYKGSIGGVQNSFAIIVTLNNVGRLKVKKREEVPMPKMPFQSVSFGATGKSILFVGQNFGSWNIYRFHLDTHELIQLTDNFQNDKSPQEWNPSLVVSTQQGALPLFWGEIKANQLGP